MNEDYKLLSELYKEVKTCVKKDCKNPSTGDCIEKYAMQSHKFLLDYTEKVELTSLVKDKQYFSYSREDNITRPINIQYFIQDPDELESLLKESNSGRLQPSSHARLSYTIALSPCLAMESVSKQNKKGPATYFECYIGHKYARSVGVNPVKSANLPVLGNEVPMTMDFLFEFDDGRKSIHMPVKMSTRERIVQAWSHQRILNATYGEDSYEGVMMLFSETKLDERKREVVEICVPYQWLVYQTLLARMDKIYYFDMPKRYSELSERYSEVFSIKPFICYPSEIEEVRY